MSVDARTHPDVFKRVCLVRRAKVRTHRDTEMPTAITRDEVRDLLAHGAQLVDVLAAEEYAEEHLPGAINLFIKTLDAASTRQLRRDRAVIVYCHDLQ